MSFGTASDPPSMTPSSNVSSHATPRSGLGSISHGDHELVLAPFADSDNRKGEEARMGYALDAALVSVMMMGGS